MDIKELKFLLTLLGCKDYRSSYSASIFDSFKGKEKICQNLAQRELVDFSQEIAKVKILPPGQALLKLAPQEIPIDKKQLQVLQSINKASGEVAPSKIAPKSLKAIEKAEILHSLAAKGLIETELKIKRQRAEVWLTQRGIETLRDDYIPKGAANISLDLLSNYVRFLRKTLTSPHQQVSSLSPNQSLVTTNTNISDGEILEIIRELDHELGTDNYLPIFHLRQKLQPPFSRDYLDQALYRLQASDKIELSTLLDPTGYTKEQVEAGIPQNVGGSLFFLSVC